jgi:hypothetical protein
MREWGASDWKRLALRRSLALWREDQGAAVALAARPAGAAGHGAETTSGFVFEGQPPVPVPIADARLSSTTDAAGRVLRAGLELWESDDSDFPRRGTSEAVASAVLPTAGLTLACTFVRGWMDGHAVVGVYQVLSPEPPGGDGTARGL